MVEQLEEEGATYFVVVEVSVHEVDAVPEGSSAKLPPA